MRISRFLATWVSMGLIVAAPLQAQFSSNIPGIPRASIPFYGGSQGRFEFDVTGIKVPAGAEDDSIGARLRLGFGKSWRIASNFEFGFDVTLAEANFERSPTDSLEHADQQDRVFGSAGYGLRFGFKARPISYLSPKGHGFDVAVGVAYQPSLEPVASMSKVGDTTTTSGLLGSDPEGPGEEAEAPKVHAATQFLLALSYTNPRVTVDAALLHERTNTEGLSPLLVVYQGLSPRLGVKLRLTHGFSLGGMYWGTGAPPWRDRLAGGIGAGETRELGLLLGFGSTPGKGTDLMITSPTGSFGESINLYWRLH